MTMATPNHVRTFRHVSLNPTTGDVASAHDHVGDGYGRYADGDGPEDPSQAANRFAHADAIVWATICDTIDQLRDAGVSSLRVLDAGCGPGTWTQRIAGHAHRPRSLRIEAVGFDISSGQLEIALKNAEHLNAGCPSDTTKLEFLTRRPRRAASLV